MRPLDRRVLPHLTPARTPLAGVVAAGVASGVLLVGQAFAVSALVVALFHGASAGSGSSLGEGRWEAALTSAGWLAAVTLARAAVAWVGDVCSARAAATVSTTMRRRVLGAALRLGPLALSRRQAGEVALLTTRGMVALEPYLTRYLPTLVVAATLPPLTVLAIAWQDRLSALIVVLTLPLVPVFAILIGLATRDRADRQWRLLAQLSGHFLDVVRGLPTLVAYRRADAQSASIRRITHRYREATTQTLRLGFASSAALELVATLSVALVAVTVGLRLTSGSLDLQTALVVLLLAPEAYWPLRRVGAEYHAAAEGTATFEQATALLDGVPDGPVTEAPAPWRRTPDLGLTLSGVGVTYPGRTEPVLRDLGATIPARGITAVTGPSGCGKSTLLSVLAGDLLPTEGRLLVGTDLVGSTVLTADLGDAWQARIAWVPQRPWILAGTLAENVRLGRPDATDAEVWAALERVHLGDLVATLPAGLQTVVGEDGTGTGDHGTVGLSAGQRARLALARAVVAERPLVLLDEPTAHLDADTEQVILDTLQWLGRRSTVVVVAHRAAVVDIADHVLDLPAPASLPSARTTARAAARTAQAVVAVSGSAPATRQPEPAVSDGTDPADPAPTGHYRHRLAGGVLLGALASASGVALTATAGWLIAQAASHPPVLTLMVAIVGVRTFGLARPVLRYAERLVSHDAALAMLADRRARVFDVLVPLTPGRLTRRRGDLLTSVVDDVDSLLDAQLRVRMPVATAVLVGLLAAGFATWQLPVAGLVVTLVCVLGAGGAWMLARTGVRRSENRYVEARGRLSGLVVQTLAGAGDLVKWQAVDRSLDEVDEVGTAAGDAARRSARSIATARALVTAVAGLGMLAVAWVGGPALAGGSVSRPMLALLVLLPLALAEVLAPVADAGALSVRTQAADARLARLAALTPAVTSPALPVVLAATDLAHPRLGAAGVAGGWGSTPAFSGLDLDLAPGARLGVVGPSGCGKSTLAAVLLRFLDPLAGVVDLDGTDLRSLALADVRSRVGLVDDDPHVFGSTLRENLRLARPDADDATLVDALRRASLDTWAAALPDGLDTRLGDGGAHVSGGERARIGLARAVLADHAVLVLDEPTAHLDAATAEAVTEDLLRGTGRSVVWITHGTVGLDRMDQVLDLGRIGQSFRRNANSAASAEAS